MHNAPFFDSDNYRSQNYCSFTCFTMLFVRFAFDSLSILQLRLETVAQGLLVRKPVLKQSMKKPPNAYIDYYADSD